MSGEAPNRESIDRPLAALRGAGTVFGVLFFKGVDVVFNETPFSADRIVELAQTLDDISFYFVNEGRDIDQMSFGFDGGNMLIVSDQDCRIVVMHSITDEVDFVAKASRAFLIDYQMGIFASELNEKGSELAQSIASGDDPQESLPVEEPAVINVAPIPAAAEEEDHSAATGPIQPILAAAPAAPATQPIPAPQNPSTRERPPVRPIIEPEDNPDANKLSEEELADTDKRAVLAANQPESTLPPPRKPKIRR